MRIGRTARTLVVVAWLAAPTSCRNSDACKFGICDTGAGSVGEVPDEGTGTETSSGSLTGGSGPDDDGDATGDDDDATGDDSVDTGTPTSTTGVPTACGDGVVDPGEECDDANSTSTDACIDCRNAVCGDAFVHAGVEECDDANADDTDGCVADCKLATCGDGFVQAGVEACDDANEDNADGCLDTCAAAACGDGFVHEGVEACDGVDFGTASCHGLGQPGGALACGETCTIVTDGCVCGTDQPPTGTECPAECTGGCVGTTCIIDCASIGACEGAAIVCPSGWDCLVHCQANSGCRNATIACVETSCDVVCAGVNACQNAVTTCGSGLCNVSCGNGPGVCSGLELVCGPNAGSVFCASPQTETVTPLPDGQCSCTAVGC